MSFDTFKLTGVKSPPPSLRLWRTGADCRTKGRGAYPKIHVFLIYARRAFLLLSLGSVVPTHPGLQTAQEAVQQATQIVGGFNTGRTIPILFDNKELFTRATYDGTIRLGAEMLDLPLGAMRGVLGHEVSHLILNHARFRYIGITLYCLYRALAAFLWTAGAILIFDNLFDNAADGSGGGDWTDASNDVHANNTAATSTACEPNKIMHRARASIPLIIPALVALFSSAHIFQFSRFELIKSLPALMLYTILYALMTYGTPITSWLGTIAEYGTAYVNAGLAYLAIDIPELTKITSTFATALLLYVLALIIRSSSLYCWRRTQHSLEIAADTTGARLFGTGRALVEYLEILGKRFPAGDTGAWSAFHPTPSQRIAALGFPH